MPADAYVPLVVVVSCIENDDREKKSCGKTKKQSDMYTRHDNVINIRTLFFCAF